MHFRTLVDRANDWLRSNRKWEIVNCESVEFQGDRADSEKMMYIESRKTYVSYYRGLRSVSKDYSVLQKKKIFINISRPRVDHFRPLK